MSEQCATATRKSIDRILDTVSVPTCLEEPNLFFM